MNPAKHEKSRRTALAILSDSRRRGGWRVARVQVVTVLELGGAEVEERTLRPTPHWLPFARLSSRGARDLGAKFRELLRQPATLSPAPEEAQSAAVETLAGKAGAEEVTHDRANGYVPEPV